MSQIASSIGLTEWVSAGWTGQGQSIGIIDRGFGGLRDFEADFGVSVTVANSESKDVYNVDAIIHGTQVLEAAYAVAPGAEYHVCAYRDFLSFVRCVDWMIRAEVDIVNHSAGVPALPLDGSSPWAGEVTRATEEGILWINAAGNFANGFYTDFFTDNDRDQLHEFRGAQGNAIALGVEAVGPEISGVVMLSWEDKADVSASSIDLDLYILDYETGQQIAASQNRQLGNPGDQALEYLRIDMSRPFAVQIRGDGIYSAGTRFVLFVEYARLSIGTAQGSIITPGDSSDSLTVGALQGAVVAPYSSRGPLEDGEIGISLVAPGEMILRDGSEFIGTSAAAPVIAGVAALVWEAYPDSDVEDVREYILRNTTGGVDINQGNGRLLLPLPPDEQRIQTSPTATLTLAAALTSSPDPLTTAVFNVIRGANLRSGPGTDYPIVGNASTGDSFPVIARFSDWYLINRNAGLRAWIWSNLGELLPPDAEIPLAETIPAPPVVQPAEPTATPGSGGGESSGGGSGQPVPTNPPAAPTPIPTDIPPPSG